MSQRNVSSYYSLSVVYWVRKFSFTPFIDTLAHMHGKSERDTETAN